MTGLIKRTTNGVVPPSSKLARSLLELQYAFAGHFEAFYRQGVILDRIRVEQQYKDAGFESFRTFIDEVQPCGMKHAHARRLINAKDVRDRLPESPNGRVDWSERALRPLTHSDFTPADQRRLGKKVLTRVKRGEKLTASLVKEICDTDRNAVGKKVDRQMRTAHTPASVLEEMRQTLTEWRVSVESFDGDFWEDAESDAPGRAKLLSGELSKLASIITAKCR